MSAARQTAQMLSRRNALEDAVERALAALDALDGDPDFEAQCEDEGAQCDDEGGEETDLDQSDYEASLCGITFGFGTGGSTDVEGTGAPFVMDQRETEMSA